MPLFRLPSRKRDGGEQQQLVALDLELAVKNAVGEKVLQAAAAAAAPELGKMIEELDLGDVVPTVFICPISLEPMQDPVTLCTGQTYERCNILKWFSLGRFTCPTTMQELWDDSITPNATLSQLIHGWYTQKYMQAKKRSEDVKGRVMELLGSLKTAKGQCRVQNLKDLNRVAAAHASARKTLVDESGVGLLCSLLGPFTSHAVGSEVIAVLVNLPIDCESKLCLMQPAKISLVVDMLNEGSIETKINCTRLVELLMDGKGFREEILSSLSLLVGLLRLVRDKRFPNGIVAGLGLLRTVCSHEQVRSLVVSVGAVPQLVELVPSLNPDCLECALYILEVLSALPEGRLALKDCSQTIPNVVKLLMRVSEICTEYTLSILWALCELAPEECASRAVEAGLAAKLLLVIQSGCSPALKQRASELLKLCSLSFTPTTFISKCKLTRTIQ